MVDGEQVTLRSGRVTVTGDDLVRGSVRAAPEARARGGPGPVDPLLAAVTTRFDVAEALELEAEVPPPRTRGPDRRPVARVDVDVARDRHPVLLVQDARSELWSWVFPTSAGAVRSAAGPVTSFEVPLDGAVATRGIAGAVAKKVIRVLVERVAGALIGAAAESLAQRWEATHRPAGIRWFTAEDHRAPRPSARFAAADAERLRAGRSLLFVHGTTSLSHSGFARLPVAVLAGLERAYGGRVWAYDHPTVGTTPTENAAWLLDQLAALHRAGDPAWEVDVIAHSRGGLVARELAERPGQSCLRLRDVVFFATPNGGTPLCSPDHLDRFVSHHTNLLTLIPDNVVTDTIDAVLAVVQQVARAAYGGLSGVLAMDPSGAYLAGLNELSPQPGVRYHAVASDYEAAARAGVATRLRDLAFDRAFGGEANDLIVPTASASVAGGRQLVPPERCHVFDQDDAVDHSGYWDAPAIAADLPGIVAGTARPLRTTRAAGVPRARREHRPVPAVRDGTDPRIEVSVVHGSLEYARYPVMVGHFEGATLKGAEAFLDHRLDGLLSGRQMIGQYPQRPGEAIFLRPRRRAIPGEAGVEDPRFPPGAYVLGLGAAGELTRRGLTRSVTTALVDRGIELYEQSGLGDELVEFGVASVLVGAFPVDGLTIEASLVAIVEGLLAANETFQRYEVAAGETRRPLPRVRVTALEVIERYADRAELAAHAVRLLPRIIDRGDELADRIEQTDVVIEVRAGGLPARPPLAEAERSWRRVLVSVADGQHGGAPPDPAAAGLDLDVTVLGRLARADRLRHPIDRRTVDNLVAAAIGDARPDAQVENTLWELLLPVELKDDLIGAGSIQLVVDERTANYPWEIMRSRGAQGASSSRSLARGGLLRQFREGAGGQRFRVQRAVSDAALVVGNPPISPGEYPWSSDVFDTLPGAAAEARTVSDVLKRGSFEVTSLVWGAGGYEPSGDEALDRDAARDSGRTIVNALFGNDHRIVHVAAHGMVSDDPAESGAVIGSGMHLTANVIRQLRVVPDMVFLNCCHLAKVGFNRLAAGIARELMGIGVQVVVAAGWAVDDHAAEAFAGELYGMLLSGADYGDAVHAARDAARKASASLTWGAYQCYGDPGFRLTLRGGVTASDRVRPVSRSELLRQVRTVSIEVGDVGRPDTDQLERRRHRLLDDLDDLVAAAVANPSWLDGEVGYEIGRAYGELDALDQAVHWYRLAASSGSTYPLALLDLLASSEMAVAQRHLDPAGAPLVGDEPVDDLVASAWRHLGMALTLGETPARKAIEGSLAKKEATLDPGGDACQALVARSAAAYRAAHEQNRAASERDPRAPRESYQAFNWLQMASLAEPWPLTSSELAGALDDVLQWLRAAPPVEARSRHDLRVTPDFWARAQDGDLALTTMMVTPGGTGITPAAVDRVVRAYLVAFATRSSWRDRRVVLEHLHDVRALAHARPELVAAITEVASRLEEWELVNVPHAAPTPPAPAPAVTTRQRRTTAAVQVEMLPAAHGDCLWLEYGDGHDRHRVLVDGGPVGSYPAGLGGRLVGLPEGDRHLDLLVVSHIDTDHIDGCVRALQERGVGFDDIWFNGWKHLPAARGGLQGAMLDALLDGRPWNAAFGGDAVVVTGDGGPLPTATLPGGAVVTLLSPEREQLEVLHAAWRKALEDSGRTPGSPEDALRLLDERTEYRPLERGGAGGAFGDDHAPANGSSIAFLFEFQGRACLFGADAHAPVLVRSLRRLAAERGVDRVRLDAFKLPHHGSMSNVTEELLALVDCRRYLVSTSGAKFSHPDPETVELVGAHRAEPSEVWFNYLCDTTRRWLDPEEQARANVVARHPTSGAGILVPL